jgi:hypothetical protein
MIAQDSPGCDCRHCAGCLARAALAGPAPGEAWNEWERMKEVNRERLRQRQAPDFLALGPLRRIA